MKTRISEAVQEYWDGHLPELQKRVEEASQRLSDLIMLEDHYRSGSKDPNRLKNSLGAFGSQTLNLASLSSVLHQGYEARTMERDRMARIESTVKKLGEISRKLRQKPPQGKVVDLKKSTSVALSAFETHIQEVTDIFRWVRAAILEARGHYNPKEHDLFFETFNWRQMNSEEMKLCPPFVVYAGERDDPAGLLGDMLALLTAGKPIKVVVERNALADQTEETGRAAALKSPLDMALLFLSLRHVYFLQTSSAADQPLKTALAQGLGSLRPSVISLLSTETGSQNGTGRALKALQSRAFPHFEYDPDRATDFVACLDISHNPGLVEPWIQEPLEYMAPDGESGIVERAYTFADFAAEEPGFANHFTPLAGDIPKEKTATVGEFLSLSIQARRGVTPFVYALDANHHLQQWVPSQALLAQTADRMHLWHTLQELGGIRNPHVRDAEARVSERLVSEREASLASLREEMETKMQEREASAVSMAMRNLALKLTGMTALETPSSTSVRSGPITSDFQSTVPMASAVTKTSPTNGESPSAFATDAAPVAPVGDGPWIDQALCTTCDECTTLNKKIFAYDAAKKAYIKDPHGGPYKDIVRAAEKCASEAIHPGLPQNPAEKDTQKWVQRAEKFQ